jgi:hypothetical protein
MSSGGGGTDTQWGKRPRNCRNVQKVAVYDLDNTATIGAEATCPLEDRSVQPAWPHREGAQLSGTTETVKEAIRMSQEYGFHIAFATSESYDEATNERQKAFVRHIYPEANDAFFDSAMFQHAGKSIGSRTEEYPLKQAMYTRILGKGGLDVDVADWPCSIVFDDEVGNLRDAQTMGLRVVQASPVCGGQHCVKGCGIPPSSYAPGGAPTGGAAR